MTAIKKYPHGTVSWADLSTTDPEGAKAFLTGLFGWTYEDMPVGEGVFYTMYSLNGVNVAASSGMMAEQQEMGVPPHWNTYITVDDVEVAAGQVEELGGKLMMPPFDVFDSGRMCVVEDPAGAVVSFWQAGTHPGAGVVNAPGAMVWNENVSRDRAAAQAFYGKLMGWTFEVDPSNPTYTVIKNGDRYNGGMLEMTDEWPEHIPPHWMVYFGVADLDATLEKVKELGGAPNMEPVTIPAGRFCVIRDPQGAVFTLFETETYEAVPESWL